MTADKAPAVGAVPQGDDYLGQVRFRGDVEGRLNFMAGCCGHTDGGSLLNDPGRDLIREATVLIGQQVALLAERDARIAELEQDAARYRWLRVDVARSAVPRVWASNEHAEPTVCLHGKAIDAAIDALLRGDG